MDGPCIEFPDRLTPGHSAVAHLQQRVRGEGHSILGQAAVGSLEQGHSDIHQWRQIGQAGILRPVRSGGLGGLGNTQY